MGINVRTLMAEPNDRAGMAHIQRVTKDDPHTLVVKQGGSTACLAFKAEVLVADLLAYCRESLGWNVEGLPFVVNGERYAGDQAGLVALKPGTEQVKVGQTDRPSVLEVTRKLGSKG